MLDMAMLPAAALVLTTGQFQSFESTSQASVQVVYNAFPELKDNESSLRTLSRVPSLTGEHVTVEQSFKGVPVLGGRAVVHFDKRGQSFAINSQLATDSLDISTTPVVSASQAAKKIILLDNSKPQDVKTKLLIIPFKDGAKLAWRVVAPSQSGPSWEIFVDAHTGEALSTRTDSNRYSDDSGKKMGQIFPVSPSVVLKRNDLQDDNGSTASIPDAAYSQVELFDLDESGYMIGKYASSKGSARQTKGTGGQFLFKRGQPGFNETMGYYFIDYAQRFIQSLGFNSINNRQVVFAVDRLEDDNSFYSPSDKQISFGKGGVDDSEDAEVILHELGHAIQDNQVEDWGDTMEGRAMGEGFGDFFAASTLAALSNGFQDDCIAEWDAVSYSDTNPPCLRRLDSQKIYPRDIKNQEHADGEIWSALLWDIYGKFGREASVKLVLESHFYLTSRAKFENGAKALVIAAEKLDFASDDIAALEKLITKRGLSPN